MQGLMSRDSIVDRQFVTAWVIERLTTIRFMCHAVPSTVVRRRRFFLVGGGAIVRSVQAREIQQ